MLLISSSICTALNSSDVYIAYTYDDSDKNSTHIFDLSGYNQNGTIVGTTNTTGIINEGELNSYGKVIYSPTISTASNYSFNTWVKYTDHTETGKEHFAGVRGDALIQFYRSAGNIYFYYFSSAENIQTTDFSDNNWHMITFVYDSGNDIGYIYKDGVQAVNGTITNAYIISSSRLTVGNENRYSSYPYQALNGSLDESTLWLEYVLNDSEVEELYNSGTGLQYPFNVTPPTPESNLTLFYYSFDYGLELIDIANYTYNLTDYNTSIDIGKLGNGRGLDGLSSYLTNDLDVSTNLTGDFSMCGWFYPYDMPNVSTFHIFGFNGSDRVRLRKSEGNYSVQVDGSATDISGINDYSWNHVCLLVDREYNYSVYVNGVFDSVTSETDTLSGMDKFVIGMRDSDQYYNGSIDEVVLYNYLLSNNEISNLYGGGYGNNTYSNGTLSFTPLSPLNSSTFLRNYTPVTEYFEFGVYNLDYDTSLTCNLYENESIIDTLYLTSSNNLTAGQGIFNFSRPFYMDYNYSLLNYNISCNTSDLDTLTEYPKYITTLIDSTNPTIIIYDPTENYTIYKGFNDLFLNISVIDDNLFNTSIRVLYPNGSEYYSNVTDYHNVTWYNFSDSFDLSGEPSGEWLISVRASDGHTKEYINNYDVKKSDKTLSYNDFIDIKLESKQDIIDYSTTKSYDRYTFEYDINKPDKLKYEDYVFIVRSKTGIIYLSDSKYKAHFITDKYWIDFELEDYKDEKYKIKKISNYEYEVTITSSKDKLKFKSIGELNINEVNQSFYVTDVYNYSENYLNNTVEYIPHNITLNLTNVNSNLTDIDVMIEYNGTLHNVSDSGDNTYIYEVTDIVGSSEFELIEHRWVTEFEILDIGNYTLNTTPVNQSAYNENVLDEILTFTNTHLLNISIYDETSGDPIYLDVGLSLIFDNGYHNTTFNTNYESNHSINFYSSPNSSIYNLSYLAYGQIQLSGTYNNVSYVANTITIPLSDAIEMINNGTAYNLDLYAIGLGNSTTVTFNWKTTGYVDITGTMRIYRCSLNGSRSLVSSVPITTGVATGNIELLTAQYSYDLIYNGLIYQQDSFYTCHVESLEERTFFVDISELDVSPVINLYLIDCSLVDLGNSTYQMTWSNNPSDSNAITGCLVQSYTTLSGKVENYRNCTNTSNSLIRVIPDISENYVISGEISQSGNIGFCRQDIRVSNQLNAGSRFGATLLFSFVLLLMGLSLLYAGQSTESIVGAILSLIISYFLGILALSWEMVTIAVSILIIIVLVIRYSKND